MLACARPPVLCRSDIDAWKSGLGAFRQITTNPSRRTTTANTNNAAADTDTAAAAAANIAAADAIASAPASVAGDEQA
jgi:hypothetical protein